MTANGSEPSSTPLTPVTPEHAHEPRPSPRQLTILGGLTLFIELALIRYLAGTIWNLGYFPNLVLLAAFLGMGIGYSFHHLIPERDSDSLFVGSAIIVQALITVVHRYRPMVPDMQNWTTTIGKELYFTSGGPLVGEASYWLFGAWFGLIVIVFALVSQRTAKVFRRFTPLSAYFYDIFGSMAGIVMFMIISAFQVPAWIWFLGMIPLFCGGLDRPSWARCLIICLTLLHATWIAFGEDRLLLGRLEPKGSMEVTWSPYQKVEFREAPSDSPRVFVNGIAHQSMLTLESLNADFYSVPYRTRLKKQSAPPLRSVLIIGAGNGNDVAAGLANGATYIDAVEIDPAIAESGIKHHPARPYQDARVHLTIDDGRAFMTRTRRKYDLIVFALTDSLVKLSAMAQLRLENYLFTQESIDRAYQLLTPDGELCFYNWYRRPWVSAKIARMAYAATGLYPIVQRTPNDDFVLMMVGRHSSAPPPPLDRYPISLPHDDWPFLYLEDREVPAMYLKVMAFVALLVIALLVLLEVTAIKKSGADHVSLKVAFALMGIAFMLLETKSIIQFSLLFGTTWINNSLVFFSVLALVLAATVVAAYLPDAKSHLWLTFVLLLLSCFASIAVPVATLLAIDSVTTRFLVASVLVFSPIFFANLLFSMSFRDCVIPEHVFGWNLLGATLGGVVEYISMATGYRFLAWMVAAAYSAVFLLILTSRTRQSK